MKLVPLSDEECDRLATAIDDEVDSLEDAITDEPSATTVEGWRADIRELLALRRKIGGDPV